MVGELSYKWLTDQVGSDQVAMFNLPEKVRMAGNIGFEILTLVLLIHFLPSFLHAPVANEF